MSNTLSIGLISYAVDTSKVFVRVPNERGRWMLVDRCVVEVDCPHCKAVTGEPCRRKWPEWSKNSDPGDASRYHICVHVDRRRAWQELTGYRTPSARIGPHKLRLRADEIAQLQSNAPNDFDPQPPEPPTPEIDVVVTRKEPKP